MIDKYLDQIQEAFTDIFKPKLISIDSISIGSLIKQDPKRRAFIQRVIRERGKGQFKTIITSSNITPQEKRSLEYDYAAFLNKHSEVNKSPERVKINVIHGIYFAFHINTERNNIHIIKVVLCRRDGGIVF